MRKFYALAITLMAALFASAQISVTVTGNTNTTPALQASYPSLTAALADLNAITAVSGAVALNCASGTETAPAGGFVVNFTAATSAVNTITIAGNGATLTASGALTAGALNDAVFKIIGSDYVVLQGFIMMENAANTSTTAGSNNMTEWGIAVLYASVTDGAQNITIQNNTVDLNRTYQNSFGIYVNATHSATAPTTSATATGATGGNSGLKIYSNTITDVNNGIVVVGPTAAADQNDGVEIGGTASTANTITNYGSTGTFSSYANVSGTVYGILVRNSKNFTISHNSITSSNGGTTAGTLRGIFVPSFSNTVAGTVTNAINNNDISVTTGVVGGTLQGITAESSSANATTTLSINNNNFSNSGYNVASPTGATTFISTTAAALTTNISNNTFTNLSISSTGSVTFISHSYTMPAGASQTISNNSIVTGFTKTGSGGTVTGTTSGSSSPNGTTSTTSNNNFSNITVSGATNIQGTLSNDGSSSSPAKIFINNTYTNWTAGTGSINGMTYNYVGAATSNFSNNTFSNFTGQGSVAAMTVGSSFDGANVLNIASNTITGLSSTGTGAAVTGITCSNVSTTININNNVVNGLSTTGASAVVGIGVTDAATTNVFKNKISDLTANNASGTVNGILVSSGTAVNVYNNLVGDLKTPQSSATNPLIGLNITGGTTVNAYYNTVYLSGSSTGTNFGSSAVSTSTTPTVDLRNNIFVNTSTATGTGLTVAYRRSSTTLTSYAPASNNNLFYAGTPGVANLIFYDGTNADQTLAAFKTRVSPRDAASVTESPNFLSISGVSANFLHINPAVPTLIESGGAAITGITDDYDNDTRNATTPDIGADEFIGTTATVNDLAVGSLVNPAIPGCENASVPVTVRLVNSGTTTINFATNSATVNVAVTGAATANLSATVSTGTLAPGATLDVVLSPTLSMLSSGTYNFTISLTMTGDADASNNNLNAALTINPVLTLPQTVDFTGYTGTNLSTVFPNWYEAAGATAPSGTTSSWTNTTGNVGGATNVTGRINLYTNTRNEWIIGPKFAATANSKLKFDVAITDFNSSAVDPAAMQGTDDKVVVKVSTDCGNTWANLYTFDATNTTSISNSFVAQEINLGTYAGQNIIIAFFASDGPVDDAPDYDFHIDNINIVNVLPTDVGATALALPASIACYSGTETVKVTIKNYGTSVLDFSVNPVTVTTNVTGTTTAVLTGTINTGTLAANGTVDVTMTGTLNMSAAGVYTFNASTSMTGDAQSTNDAMPATTRTVVAPVVLPQTVDFTGFTGANLSTVFPNWYEASGFPNPLGTTSSWVDRTGLGSATNVTAKVNLYTTGKNEWIIGPKFTATALTQLTYKVALTDYNSTAVDPSAMQGTDDKVVVKISTDCGNSWSDLITYDASTTTAISNTLTTQTIPLGTYAGQNIIIAFYANEGTVDNSPDYDFHIDDINISDVPGCTGAVGGTAAIGTSVFCGSGSATITATGYSTGTGSVYQWESSTDNANFASVAGQTNPASITTGTLTDTTYYRLKVTCPSGTATAYSNTITVTVNPLPTATITPAGPVVLCAPATQVLTASTNASPATYQWILNGTNIGGATSATHTATATGSYTVSVTETATTCVNTSTAVLVTINPLPGNISLTPSSAAICAGGIQQITASTPGSNLNVTSGTGASTSSGSSTSSALGPNPLQNYYGADKVQMLFTAAELTALGLSGGSPITAIRLHLAAADNTYALQSLSVKMKNTSTAVLSTAGWETGLTTVKNPASYSPAAGVNTLTLDNAFAWDGSSNLAIEINYSNNNAGTTASSYNTALHSPTSFVSTIMYRADNVTVATADGYTVTPNFSYSSRNDLTLVTSAPNFTWAPVTGLYSDAAATIPYTGAGAATVYAKPAATTSYTVTATSAASCTSTNTISVTVNAATAITTQPTAATVCAGTNASFAVAATGSTLTYQWRKAGVDITGATNNTLSLTNVSAADAASYDVVITGTCGTVTSTAVTLTINAATAISTQPTAQSVCAGANATFTVAATGSGTLTYQWRKGGVNIGGATNASYTVTNVTAADAANYDVVVTGGCGNATSSVVALTLKAATAINTQPVNQTVCAGANVTFSIAASGAGTLSYQWRKGGISIGGATGSSLTLNNVSGADVGSYDVVVTGDCGNLTSTSVTLTLNAATAITTQPTVQTVCAGATATFTVAATGSGTLTYQWRKAGTNINGATTASLTLNNVSATDAANYDVVVTGSCGNITSSAVALTVNPKPAVDYTYTSFQCRGTAYNYTNLSTVPSGTISSTVWDFGDGSSSTTVSPSYLYTTAGTFNVKLVVTTNNGCKDSVTKAVTVAVCTAIPQVTTDVSSALLLPNLVDQSAVLRLNATRTTKINWTVVDMQGRTVMSFDQQVNSGQTDRTIFLGQLASGSYQLNGTTGKGKPISIRFVKQ